MIGGDFGNKTVTITGRMEPGTSGPAPAKPAEAGTIGTAVSTTRKKIFAITGNNAKTAWKLAHKLETKAINVVFQAAEGEVPGTLQSLSTVKAEVKAISESEVEIVYEKAPAAKGLLFITVYG